MATREEVRQEAYVPALKKKNSMGSTFDGDMNGILRSTDNIYNFMPGSKELIDDEELFMLSARSSGHNVIQKRSFDDVEDPYEREKGQYDRQEDDVDDEEEELRVINNASDTNRNNRKESAIHESEEWDCDGYGEAGYKDDAEAPKEEERAREEKTHRNRSGLPYQHEVAMPKFFVGSKKLSISEAQLFGLLDKVGNLQIRSASPNGDPRRMRKHVEKLSAPRSPVLYELNDEEERNLTFQPKRSAEALAAMKNKRCGYDFMDRLSSRGDFLDRIAPDPAKTKKLPKSEMDALQADYEARIDKLQCPRCLRPQSFDEFFEKRRTCTLCSVKFEKLRVTSGAGFLRKMQQQEQQRLDRLKEVEKGMYGNQTQLTVVKKTEEAQGGKGSKPGAHGGDKRSAKCLSLLPQIKGNTKPKLRPVDHEIAAANIARVITIVPQPPTGDQHLPCAPPRRPASAKGSHSAVRGTNVAAQGAETILRIRKTEHGILNKALHQIQQQGGQRNAASHSGRAGAIETELSGVEARMQKLVQM
ncbi:hypothetical protein EON65_34320 [archaeon]|nr:MAG: hypothetical protein EON65_34320 [archaeon]